MIETVNAQDVVAALERAAARLVQLSDLLTRLDAAVGDGDLGINMALGGAALKAYLAANAPGDDLGKYIAGAGMAFNRAAPSTMGTLLATALMRAGKESRGLAALDGAALAHMLTAANQGIRERGNAQLGDKTILDALQPAAESFAAAVAQGEGLEEAASGMLAAARQGRDLVVPLQSKVGRAGWVGERTRGHYDPGTVLLVELFEAVLGQKPSFRAPGELEAA